MNGPSGARRAGALGLALTVIAAMGTLGLASLAAGTWPGTGVVPTEQALTTVVLFAATALAGWATGVLARASAAVLGADRDDHRSPTVCTPMPRSVRWTCAVLVALSGSTSLAASAAPPVAVATPFAAEAPGDASPVTPKDDREASVPQPGWTPTPRTAPPVAPDGVGLVSTVPHEEVPERVVVRRGDTLWDISARQLGPGATTADIAEEWPRWYAANVDLIGPDPDLILPGQELVVPTPEEDR